MKPSKAWAVVLDTGQVVDVSLKRAERRLLWTSCPHRIVRVEIREVKPPAKKRNRKPVGVSSELMKALNTLKKGGAK